MKKTMILLAAATIGFTSLNATAFDNKQQAGSVVGAVVGGIIGNQVGGGSGKIIATFIGVVAGSMIGSSIGESLDNMDKMAIRDSQEEALYAERGAVIPWRGSDYGSRTGSYGNFRVMNRGHHRRYVQETCTTYRSEINTRYKSEVRTNTSCQRSDGSWYEANSNEVVYY